MPTEVMVLGTVSFAGTAAPNRSGKPIDEAHFERLYRETSAGLWSYLFRLSGDRATADDLLQKAYLRLLHAKRAFESDEHARAYLFRIATNVALDHFRETKRIRQRDATLAARAGSDSAPQSKSDLMRTFAELNERERALLWLAHVEESRHDEIADALGLKPKSIRVLLFRARKKFAELLSRRGLSPEVPR